MKALLKKHSITEKQVELIRLVAKHPIFGATQRSVTRILPAALRHGVVVQVWLDRTHPATRTVTDTIPGTALTNTSNQWYELTAKAEAFMEELDPSWKYDRPSDRWAA